MRQIKFRGLRTDGLGWAYGSLCPDRDGDPNIIMPLPWPPIFRFKVKPETVGQFTGLHDRNGVEIFEGDIVRYHFQNAWHRTEMIFSDGAFRLRGWAHGQLTHTFEVTENIHEQ